MSYTYSDSSSRGGKAKPTVPSKHQAQVNYDNLLELGETYTLGEYTFTVTATTIPQTGLIDVIARATGPQGKIGAKTKQISAGSEIKGWYVEANDTTADVYVATHIEVPSVPHASTAVIKGSGSEDEERNYSIDVSGEITTYVDGNYREVLGASSESGGTLTGRTTDSVRTTPLNSSYTLNDKTVYYGIDSNTHTHPVVVAVPRAESIEPNNLVAWGMVYGAYTSNDSKLIGRFAITAQEAGATAGTGGEENGWEDVDDGQEPIYPGEPGYPDPEDPDYPGDDMPYFPPSKTLTVTINGALSGRHNDPLNDTSYSYIPADQIAQTQYGSGGIGGNGGGGGAGASTIIVRKFATRKADSKTFVLKPKRHGYGSGGGKGGKGGDGCILVYY